MAPEPLSPQLRIESVGFSPGAGRLVRRPAAVLFDATGKNTKLTAGFDDAATDEAAVALALSTVVDSDLDLAPFAIVQWNSTLELLVFGDLSLHSSLPSAPTITGSGSLTWVEHRVSDHLLAAHPSLQVWCGDEPEPGTNLRLGIAASTGFCLNLVVGALGEPANSVELVGLNATASSPPRPPAPVERANEAFPNRDVDAPIGTPGNTDPDTDTAGLLEFNPFPSAVTPPPPAEIAPKISTWINDSPDATTPDSTTPEPGDVLAESGTLNPVMELPDTLCVHGHSNPPDSSSCFTCGTAIHAAPVAGGSLPGVGRLVFDLRDDVVITGAATIGRKPQADGHAELVVIDHPEVSRNHAAISIDGWAVTLTDLESRNGTWVHPPTGEGLRRLDPGEQVVLVDGTVVHLGSIDICFTWVAEG